MGPIFSERVIAPPAAPVITSAADALAVTLNEPGRVDLDHLAELLASRPRRRARRARRRGLPQPGADGSWQTADAYLSGPVRTKLAAAEAAAALDPRYERNVDALRAVQPEDLQPVGHHRAARRAVDSGLDVIEAFVARGDGCARSGSATCRNRRLDRRGPALRWTAAGTSEWGTRAGTPASCCTTR